MINYGYAWLIKGFKHIFISKIDHAIVFEFGFLNDMGPSSQGIFSHMRNVI